MFISGDRLNLVAKTTSVSSSKPFAFKSRSKLVNALSSTEAFSSRDV